MKRIYWILASISLCSLTSCNGSTQDAKGCQTVKIDTVISASGQSYLQYPGKVKAAQDISLAFRVSGTIQKIYVKDGARVQAGQLLAELDPTDYQVQLDATEAEYKQIKAEAERVMALYKDNGTTPSANDKAVYGLKQITAKYQHHKDQLGYTRLYAPFSGYIQKRLFEAHETIGAGMPVLSMISSGDKPAGSRIYPSGTVRPILLYFRHLSGADLSVEVNQRNSQSQCQPAVHHAPATACRQTTHPLTGHEYNGYHSLR